MKNKLTKTGREFAYKQIGLTLFIVIVFVAIIYNIWGFYYAKSALVGGIVGIVPNIFFAHKAFKYAGAKSSKLVVESFFSGVKIKMVLMALLFALAFKFLVLLPIPSFGIFCLVMVLPLLTPFFINFKL